MLWRPGFYFKYVELSAKSRLDFLMESLLFLGVPPAGIALLDTQGYAAVLTVEASGEPRGVLNFALSSRFVLLQEANVTIQLFINWEFGSLGLCYARINWVSGQRDFYYPTCMGESHYENKQRKEKLIFINSEQYFIIASLLKNLKELFIFTEMLWNGQSWIIRTIW